MLIPAARNGQGTPPVTLAPHVRLNNGMAPPAPARPAPARPALARPGPPRPAPPRPAPPRPGPPPPAARPVAPQLRAAVIVGHSRRYSPWLTHDHENDGK